MLLEEIEPGVRKLVGCLREHGINTECSCHHEWYVQCQTLDPTSELRLIYNAMRDMAINLVTRSVSSREANLSSGIPLPVREVS